MGVLCGAGRVAGDENCSQLRRGTRCDPISCGYT